MLHAPSHPKYGTYLQASTWLEEAGYEAIINVTGGFTAWAKDDKLPVEK